MSGKNPEWIQEEVVLATELVHDNNWHALDQNNSKVKELSRLLNLAPFHPTESRLETFRNPAGVSRKTLNIASLHPDYTGSPTHASKIDELVLNLFISNATKMKNEAKIIKDEIEIKSIKNFENLDFLEDFETNEGKVLLYLHLRRERSPKLRKKKLEATRNAGMKVQCEVCEFNFQERYGERGLEYIEVHHRLPLHQSGETSTKLEDLALLCSNCHRMIHRGKWIKVDELKEIVASNKILQQDN
jgi:5-methylcytosine-specific restriction protein A